MSEQFLTKQQVAHRLQVSTKTVDRWRSNGLPWLNVATRGNRPVVRFSQADVAAFEQSRRQDHRLSAEEKKDESNQASSSTTVKRWVFSRRGIEEV